jgi:hypothetical protein
MTPILAALIFPILGLSPANPPEDTVKLVAGYWNAKDFKSMIQYVDGATTTEAADEITKAAPGGWPMLEVSNLTSKVDGGNAVVTSHVSISIQGQPPQAIDDSTNLVLRGDTWKIVPATGPGNKPAVFGAISAILVMPKGAMLQARRAAEVTTALSNLKQIALAAMMLSTDNKDKLAIDPSAVHKALSPYLKNEQIWVDPITKSKTMYSFNANLANVLVTNVKKPAETVMFYVGRKGQFEYPFKGRTIVAYVDGHVKVLTAEDAKHVIWKP